VNVRIFKLNRAVEIWFWLCPTALAARQADGWEIREEKAPPHLLRCQDRNERGCCAAVEGET
jgi:hypothetical protein